ncbi:MAG: DNA translocase FtsK [Treponema sp.]|nr:DNA translocase FtsK [Treponema sp.]
MSNNPVPFLKRSDFPARLASLLGAFSCLLGSLLLTLSIGASLFQWTFINPGPGSLLADAYGLFAFIVPLYLFCAALILFDPVFKPGRIFFLSAAFVPFLTLALGFSLIRDFEEHRRELSFLGIMGQSGLGLAVITAVVLECLGIFILQQILFKKKKTGAKPPAPVIIKNERNSNPRINNVVQSVTVINTSAPVEQKPAEQTPGAPDHIVSGLPVLTSSSGNSISVSPEPVKTITTAELYKLPDWGPLKSTTAFEELIHPPQPEASEEVLVLNNSVFSPYSQASEEFGEYYLPAEWQENTADSDQSEGVIEELIEESIEKPAEEQEELQEELIEESAEKLAESFGGSVELMEECIKEADGENAENTECAKIDPPVFSSPEPEEPQRPKKKPGKYKGTYSVPVEGILNQYPDGQYWIVDEETHQAARILQETLSEFGIQAEVTGIRKGPVITMFEILPAPGVKLSKIVNLQDNIALRLAASSIRIVAPIPGKHAVGIEVPNKKRNIVSFREIIEGELNQKKEKRRNEIPVVLGKGITGEAITVDLCQMPHLLIAGSTGSGKSVCVNSMILSILYQLSPAECRLIMIDPKIVELKLYNDIPHLLTPVITEPKKAFQALQYCIFEMERRYACLDSMGVRDIKSYNRRIKERNIAAEYIPYIVVIIDEFADLMATTGKELESTVARLAAMSRAVGIHLVLATQRPSIDVITGLIKANIPSRIAFMVASKMDSRIIIDMVGAEKLLGKGDMLYAGVVDPFPIRMQGAFISEEEVERVVEYIKTLGEPEYIDDEIFFDEDEEEPGTSLFTEGDDPLYDKALEIVIQQGKASASYIQRRLKIGYNRAARLVEEMEHRGVVGPAQGSRPRELLRAG